MVISCLQGHAGWHSNALHVGLMEVECAPLTDDRPGDEQWRGGALMKEARVEGRNGGGCDGGQASNNKCMNAVSVSD